MILIFFSYICSIMIKYNIKSEMVITIGDSHGNFHIIMKQIERLKITNTTFIHVGDFGVGFINENKEIERLHKLNKFLNNNNNTLYSIRGNHDKPEYFNDKWSDIFTNIFLVKDYTVLNINNENFLLVGGAISIDRNRRISNNDNSYFENECFVLREDLLYEMNNIVHVITHSAPDVIEPYNYNDNSHIDDLTLKDDINTERINITKMYNILKEKNNIKNWYFGHFHRTQRQDFENTIFYTLDINEFKEVR